MQLRAAHNVTDRPVVIDAAGRTLGGGEWGVVDIDCFHAQDAAAAGLINVVDEVGEGAAPEARAAHEAAQRPSRRPRSRKSSTAAGGEEADA